MQTIYLETSIICHLTDPPSTNPITRACQQLTHEKMESTRELLIGGGGLNAKERAATEHIVCAALYHCEILLTWDCANCKRLQAEAAANVVEQWRLPSTRISNAF